jgi:solute carrier family 35, member E3
MQLFITLSCLIAVSVNFSTFLVIGTTSPVTYQVLGHLKTCLILTFGYVLLRDPFTARNILGIIIAIFGMGLYSYVSVKESRNKKLESKDSINSSSDSLPISQVWSSFCNWLLINLYGKELGILKSG